MAAAFSWILGLAVVLEGATTQPSLELVGRLQLTKEGEGGSARPEVVATAERVFVVYLGNISAANDRVFAVKLYDASLGTLVASRTLVATTPEYGGPTDIRVAADGKYLYAFYETHKRSSPATASTFLWGAKYTLDDGFVRVASTPVPLAQSQPLGEAQEGAELLDDPAPLVTEDGLFVVTRLKHALGTAGRTVYRVRALDKDDLSLVAKFDLDLSEVADGRGRVASLLGWRGGVLMALATTVSDQGLREDTDDGAPSDVILLRMRPDWSFGRDDIVTVSAEPGDRENYVAGLDTDGERLYVTYKQSVARPPNGEHVAWIKMLDADFRPLYGEKVRTTGWGPDGGELRPSLEVFGSRIFSGQSGGLGLGRGDAEIYVYERR